MKARMSIGLVTVVALVGCWGAGSSSEIVKKYRASGGIDDIKNTKAVAEWLMLHPDLNNQLGEMCKPKLAGGETEEWKGTAEGEVCTAVSVALLGTKPFQRYDLDNLGHDSRTFPDNSVKGNGQQKSPPRSGKK